MTAVTAEGGVSFPSDPSEPFVIDIPGVQVQSNSFAYLKNEFNIYHSILYTPPIAEILCVKNKRAIVVCGFLMK